MKNIKVILFVFLCLILAATATGNLIQNFSAESGGDAVTVKWTSISEDELRRYELERSTSTTSFAKIFTQNAKGMAFSYTYIDNEAFMKEDINESDDIQSQQTYNYRLKIIFSDNTFTYSDIALVKHKPSSIRRTWGMIKEMFR